MQAPIPFISIVVILCLFEIDEAMAGRILVYRALYGVVFTPAGYFAFEAGVVAFVAFNHISQILM
jgi:hypothetical protein